MGRFETQLVYDVHNSNTQEYLRTFSTMDQVMGYCRINHQDQKDNPDIWKQEDYEIKTVVRLYWVED